MCCGSGALAAVLAACAQQIDLHAVDIDPVAVRCARRNISTGRVYQGDLFDALPMRLRGRVDLIVANAPYVPTSAISMLPPEARVHEPLEALDGGSDGLDVHRRIITQAPQWLTGGGHLLIEVSEQQAHAAIELFRQSGFDAIVVRSDERQATIIDGALRGSPLTD
jgi:release factor glutamine methyltransferase